MNLQARYDLEVAKDAKAEEIRRDSRRGHRQLRSVCKS